MTHDKGEPSNEMAGVPSFRTELESWAMSFRGVPVVAVWACPVMPPRCAEWNDLFEELKDPPLVNEMPKEMKSLKIDTLNVLTLSPAKEREANGLRIPARQARLAFTFEDAGMLVIGLQECRLPSQLVVTSETEDGRDGCGLWLSTRCEHLTVVHSTPRC